ncbi:MAG: sulfite exporter TauE/SafE family protein [Pseudomonadota bacterium]
MLVIGIAGLVRGFSGFGTALIFVPVAGIFLSPEEVIAVIALTGIASMAALLPRAMREGDKTEVGLLSLAALVTVPMGIWVMTRTDSEVIRWIVALVAGGTLLALLAGWRHSGQVRRLALLPIGAAAGFIGGMTGLTGPMVILFYLSGRAVAQSVRANTILFLAALDVVLVANLLIRGAIDIRLILLSGILAIPYFITSLIGQSKFDPKYERLYRNIAYAVIALAVVSGLPVWER